MDSKSDNRETIGVGTDEIIEKLLNSLLHRYQGVLLGSIKSSHFVYDGVDGLFYKCHKISLNRGGSYIDSQCLRYKIAIINSKNNDEMCFKCVVTVALNYGNIGKHPERVRRIEPFIDHTIREFLRVQKTGKCLKQTTKQLLLMLSFYQSKTHFKIQLRVCKSSSFANDYRDRQMAFSCCEKHIYITKMDLCQSIIMTAIV